jgi:hypothetical protein
MDLVASLVRSLAWPSAITVVVIVLRGPLADAIGRVRRATGPGVSVEMDARTEMAVTLEALQRDEVQEAVVVSRHLAPPIFGVSAPDLDGLSGPQQFLALTYWVEQELRRLTPGVPPWATLHHLADEANTRGLISGTEWSALVRLQWTRDNLVIEAGQGPLLGSEVARVLGERLSQLPTPSG